MLDAGGESVEEDGISEPQEPSPFGFAQGEQERLGHRKWR